MYGWTCPGSRWDVHLSGAGNRTGKVACAVAGAVHPSVGSHRAYQAIPLPWRGRRNETSLQVPGIHLTRL